LKKPSQKRAGGVAPRIGLEFKPQYHKKKKKKRTGENMEIIQSLSAVFFHGKERFQKSGQELRQESNLSICF
jgi:hypothetical protein